MANRVPRSDLSNRKARFEQQKESQEKSPEADGRSGERRTNRVGNQGPKVVSRKGLSVIT